MSLTWLLVLVALVALAPAPARAGSIVVTPTTPAAVVPPAPPGVSLGAASAFAPPPEQPKTTRRGSSDSTAAAEAPERARTESTLVRQRNIPPLWFNREFDTHRTRAIAFPPLFIHRAPKPGHPEKLLHADLSLTFGYYDKRLERRRWFNPVGLFFGGFSERKTVWGAVPLLMGYRRVGEQFNFGQFPLVWWWGTKFVKNFLVVPFHYQQKTPDSFRGVSGLLVWYGRKDTGDADLQNDRKHFVAAPFFFRFQRGLKRFDYSLVYFGGYNKLKGRKYAAFAPFVLLHESEFGNRNEVWSLPWIKRTDVARRRSSWAVPLALTFRTKSPDRELFSATPLVWNSRNALKGSRFTMAGPVGWYDDPNQRNVVGAPLFYRFVDKKYQRTTNVVAPLVLTRKSPDTTAVWTPLGGGRRTADGWGFGVVPALTGFAQGKDGRRFGTVAGLVWHAKRPASASQPARSLWVAGPLGYADRRGDRRHLGLVPALTFAGWGGGKHYQVVTPLLWHVRDANEDRRTIVAGPVYRHKTREGVDGGIAPVAFWGNGPQYRYGIVPWLLLGDVTNKQTQERTTVSPVFVRSKSPTGRTLGVAGLVWDVQRGNGAERHSLAFPFYYRRQLPGRTSIITPVGGMYARNGERTAVYGPYVRRKTANRDGWGVLPFLYHDKHPVDGGLSSTTVGFPLYFRRRTPTDDLDIWTPLVWRSSVRGETPRTGLAVVPFYFRQRQPGGVDVDAGFPFFFSRNAYRRTHTYIVATGFHRLSRKGLNAGVAPLWWWSDSVEKRRLLALPAIFHFEDKTKDEHTTIAVPLWFDRQRADGVRRWAAFPFVFGGRRGYNHSRFSLAPVGYFDIFRLQRNTRFTGFVPLLFRFQKGGFQTGEDLSTQYTLWGSAPLFLYGKDGKGRLTHGSLVYYYDRRPGAVKLYTPVFGVNNEPGKTLGWYAGIFGLRTTNTHRRTFLFPLWYRKAHRLEDTSLTLAAPPVFIQRRRKDRRFTEAGLVVWQWRQQHKVSTAVVPPVFYYSHAYAQRRLYWVLPLFIRDNNMGEDKASFVIPVAYTQVRKGENLDFVQFPLIWHIERGQNQDTFGAFAWWDIRVKGKMLQMVPALFTRWKTPERDTKVIGPGLGWWSRGSLEDPTRRSWRVLFGAFGGGVENGRKYTSILGARIDKGPAPATPTKAQARRDARRARRAAKAQARKAEAIARRQRRRARSAAQLAQQ
ncbi:MAG: hypothetical protein AAGA54_15955 [Myxococcota bacterium]